MYLYVCSYYLARFKDTYRQATIDLMLGNPVSTESLHAFGGQAAADEADALEGAEHAQILVEDCRRMLLGAAQLPIGAWGLIDADPMYVYKCLISLFARRVMFNDLIVDREIHMKRKLTQFCC